MKKEKAFFVFYTKAKCANWKRREIFWWNEKLHLLLHLKDEISEDKEGECWGDEDGGRGDEDGGWGDEDGGCDEDGGWGEGADSLRAKRCSIQLGSAPLDRFPFSPENPLYNTPNYSFQTLMISVIAKKKKLSEAHSLISPLLALSSRHFHYFSGRPDFSQWINGMTQKKKLWWILIVHLKKFTGKKWVSEISCLVSLFFNFYFSL